MTNYEKEIENMTMEKYAALLLYAHRKRDCEKCSANNVCDGSAACCSLVMRRWLEQEAKE